MDPARIVANVETGAKISLTEASHFGPMPGISPASGPSYELLKQAIKEYWRHNGRVRSVLPSVVGF